MLIHVAVLKRDIEILKELLRRGMKVDEELCTVINTPPHYYFGKDAVRLSCLFFEQLFEILH